MELHTGSIGNEGVNREKISSVSSFTGIGRSVIGDIGQTRSANNARRLVINFDCTNTMRTIEEEDNRKKKKKTVKKYTVIGERAHEERNTITRFVSARKFAGKISKRKI